MKTSLEPISSRFTEICQDTVLVSQKPVRPVTETGQAGFGMFRATLANPFFFGAPRCDVVLVASHLHCLQTNFSTKELLEASCVIEIIYGNLTLARIFSNFKSRCLLMNKDRNALLVQG